jgi:hypothetical protein
LQNARYFWLSATAAQDVRCETQFCEGSGLPPLFLNLCFDERGDTLLNAQLSPVSRITMFAVLFGLLSLATFVASVVVHFASFVPGAPVEIESVGLLHLASLALCIIVAIHNSGWERRAKRQCGDEKQLQEFTARAIPWWIWLPGMLFFIYVGVNFVVVQMRVEGQAKVENGEYVVRYKGRFVRTLTADEYEVHRRLEVRGPSGHWMLFSAIPAVYFLIVLPRLRTQFAALQASGVSYPGDGPPDRSRTRESSVTADEA